MTGRPIAAFDFDGTVTRRDTMMPFLRLVAGTRRVAGAAFADLPRLALVGLRVGDRDAAKDRVLRRLLEGRSVGEVLAAGRAYAEAVLAAELRAAALERIAWHRDQGHELVLVSASLDAYLDVIGPELGFDQVLCTRLEVRNGYLTGAMVGGNCRGAAKIARLRVACLDLAAREMWAYGDSAGDRAMLSAANHAWWMTRRGALRPGR
jgi:HAD superfamily hydrolase (TIGR01490 family)